MQLSKDNVVLMVVDMQNAFCRDEGSSARAGLDITMLKAAIGPCRTLIAAARAATIPIVFTRYVYRADYADGGIIIRHKAPALAEHKALMAGTWDIELVDEVGAKPGEIVLDKNRPSAFIGTPIESLLSGLGVRQIVACGVTTNMCVESTVRDASQRDFEVFVVEDACGELERVRHDGGIAGMRWLFADIVCVADVQAAWG